MFLYRFYLYAPLPLVGKVYFYLAAVITYYFNNPEDALKRAKAAGKQPGCWWGGITLPSGKKGWAIYKDGKEIFRCAIR